jgi:hypothetical protein
MPLGQHNTSGSRIPHASRLRSTDLAALLIIRFLVVDYPYFWWAVEPTTGDSFFLELPWRNTNPCQLWGAHFAQTFPQSCNLLVLDHGALHKPKALQWPAHGAPLFLPPESPDLTPGTAVA